MIVACTFQALGAFSLRILILTLTDFNLISVACILGEQEGKFPLDGSSSRISRLIARLLVDRTLNLVPNNRPNGYAQWLKGARAATKLVRQSPRDVSRATIIEQGLARVEKVVRGHKMKSAICEFTINASCMPARLPR